MFTPNASVGFSQRVMPDFLRLMFKAQFHSIAIISSKIVCRQSLQSCIVAGLKIDLAKDSNVVTDLQRAPNQHAGGSLA